MNKIIKYLAITGLALVGFQVFAASTARTGEAKKIEQRPESQKISEKSTSLKTSPEVAHKIAAETALAINTEAKANQLIRSGTEAGGASGSAIASIGRAAKDQSTMTPVEQYAVTLATEALSQAIAEQKASGHPVDTDQALALMAARRGLDLSEVLTACGNK